MHMYHWEWGWGEMAEIRGQSCFLLWIWTRKGFSEGSGTDASVYVWGNGGMERVADYKWSLRSLCGKFWDPV